MRTDRFWLNIWSLMSVSALFFPFSLAWGYRPFLATDAAVADPKELEIELGYFYMGTR